MSTAAYRSIGADGNQSHVINTSENTLYKIYVGSNNKYVYWEKSLDYGVTWSTPVLIHTVANYIIALGVWYNRWTPGNESAIPRIHIGYIDKGSSTFNRGDLYYAQLNLSDESSFVVGAYYNFLYFSYGCSGITVIELPNNYIYMYAPCASNDSAFVRSTNGGSSWGILGYIATGSEVGYSRFLMTQDSSVLMLYFNPGSPYDFDLVKYDGSWSLVQKLFSCNDKNQDVYATFDSGYNNYTVLYDDTSATLRVFKISPGPVVTELGSIPGSSPAGTNGAGICFIEGDEGTLYIIYADAVNDIRKYSSIDGGFTWTLEYVGDFSVATTYCDGTPFFSNSELFIHTSGATGYITFDYGTQRATITDISPSQGKVGRVYDLVITGTDFTGATGMDFGSGITVDGVAVIDANTIHVTITIDSDAAQGYRDVVLYSPEGNVTESNGFYVITSENHYFGSYPNLRIPYIDKDESKELHLKVTNLSGTAKETLEDGELILEISYKVES